MTYKLYLSDSVEQMKKIKSNSIDMILCDLPYGLTNNEEDKIIPYDLLWNQYCRIIKENGVIVLFAQGTFYIDLINSNRKMFKYDLVWNKILVGGFLNANKMPLRQHEQIAIFYKKTPTYNPQFSIGEPLHSKGKVKETEYYQNNNYGNFEVLEDTRKGSIEKYPKSILEYQKPHPSVANHRTEKPVDLLKYLILTYSNEKDLILDNTMGSGSTGVACVQTKRNFIGIENNEDYFKIAEKRIKNAKEYYYEQLKLF